MSSLIPAQALTAGTITTVFAFTFETACLTSTCYVHQNPTRCRCSKIGKTYSNYFGNIDEDTKTNNQSTNNAVQHERTAPTVAISRPSAPPLTCHPPSGDDVPFLPLYTWHTSVVAGEWRTTAFTLKAEDPTLFIGPGDKYVVRVPPVSR